MWAKSNWCLELPVTNVVRFCFRSVARLNIIFVFASKDQLMKTDDYTLVSIGDINDNRYFLLTALRDNPTAIFFQWLYYEPHLQMTEFICMLDKNLNRIFGLCHSITHELNLLLHLEWNLSLGIRTMKTNVFTGDFGFLALFSRFINRSVIIYDIQHLWKCAVCMQ